MKIYLDDIREAPQGWTRTYTAKQTIELLKNNAVQEISLDHDLAFEHYAGDYSKEETGYDVLLWIEEQVVTADYVPPVIHIHTGNPSAAIKMRQSVESIQKRVSERSLS
jgi:hypothetical protein